MTSFVPSSFESDISNDVVEIQEYNPYNIENVQVEMDDIITILKAYNVPCERLHNIKLFRRAFIHKSRKLYEFIYQI